MKKILFISNGITPYGTHFLKRVSNELTEYKLKTIYSYEYSMGKWTINLPLSIDASIVGKGEYSGAPLSIKKIFKEIFKTFTIASEIRKYRPTVVTILGYGSICHYLIIEYCKFTNIPVLLIADSNIKGDNNKGIKRVIKKIFLKRIISCSTALLPCGSLGSLYFQKYGASTNQIFWVPNEPDYASLEITSQENIENIKIKYNLQRNRYYLAFSGRLVDVKRVDLLIKSFTNISDKIPNWDLIIIGTGPLENVLKKLIPLDLHHRVIWTGFIDSQTELASIYELSDVFVLPSDFEPWALVINEAMYSGLAIVCSDIVGSAADLVKDGENGHIFKASDLQSLTEALLNTTNPKNLNAYKKASRNIINKWRMSCDPIKGYKAAINCYIVQSEKLN